MSRDQKEKQQPTLQNETCMTDRGKRKCKCPHYVRSTCSRNRKDPVQLRRRVSRRVKGRKGGWGVGRGQQMWKLASPSEELDFIVLCIEKQAGNLLLTEHGNPLHNLDSRG